MFGLERGREDGRFSLVILGVGGVCGEMDGGMVTKEFVLGGVIWGDKGRSCDIQLAQ